MAISRKARITPGDLSLVFGAVSFPIHVWAIMNVLMIFPAWLLRMSLWELAGGISYPLVEALLESLLLWALLVGVGLILPRRWFAEKFAPLGSLLGWLLAGWAVLVQYIYSSLLQWGPLQWIPGALLVVLTIGLVVWSIHRFKRLEHWVRSLAQGLSVVAYIYMIFDLLGLVVIILRNV